MAKKKAAFLEAVEGTADVSASALKVGIPRRTIYGWRDADAEFAAAWEKAVELGTDALEDEAVRRGREGTLRPVYQGGKHVGDVREYSDTLLIFMLKARRPEKYRDNARMELAGDRKNPVFPSAESTLDRIEELAASFVAVADRTGGVQEIHRRGLLGGRNGHVSALPRD
jgi:hypothetical protein